MQRLTRKEMINAMETDDAGYDGRFWVGVLSTGIYCLPSCKAKLPLIKNVKFFFSREEAIAAGLRGCLRCRSAYFPDMRPQWLKIVFQHMKKNTTERIDERAVAELADVDITTVRRYFKTHYKTTPLAFHRKLRLARAKRLLETGADYLTAAYECGFESASGFRDAFEREFGTTPGRYQTVRK
jgi:methylphosphotriester-DNA--protein-cysteine methyltransferase